MMVSGKARDMSYYLDRNGPSLVEDTLGSALQAAAAEVPGRPYLIDGLADRDARTTMTYAEVLEAATALARAFAGRFARGDRIALWAANSPDWVVLEFAAALSGLTLVTVNPAFRQEEVAFVVSQSQCRALFIEASYRDVPMADIAQTIAAGDPRIEIVHQLERLNDFVIDNPPAPLPEVSPDDDFMIQFTSGTTGQPKGAVLTHRGVLNAARLTFDRLALTHGSHILLATPLFHTGGSVYCVLGALWNRGTLIVMRQFDAGLLLKLVEDHSIAYFQAVPTIHLRIIEHPDFATSDMSSLVAIASGGTAVAEELIQRFENAYGAEYMMVFGQTETSSTVCHTGPGDSLHHKSRTIGRPLPHIEIKVIEPSTGAILERESVGEICVRGFGVMSRYFGLDEETARTIDADGWLHTGDLGRMEEDGYLTIEGRLKDMIIRGGENIFPREIEDVLMTHPAVLEVAVFGVSDVQWGENIAAAVRVSDNKPSPAELAEFLRQRIARFKVPRFWAFVDGFPTTPAGKIQKFVLRQQVADGEISCVAL